MKKSSLVALILGTVSFMLFAIGMCMALITEWDMLIAGIIVGCIGIIFAVATLFIWRKMEKKPPLKINKKNLIAALIGIIGALVLGSGMCLVMVWDYMLAGIIVGVAGIIILMSLIPIIKGIKQ